MVGGGGGGGGGWGGGSYKAASLQIYQKMNFFTHIFQGF